MTYCSKSFQIWPHPWHDIHACTSVFKLGVREYVFEMGAVLKKNARHDWWRHKPCQVLFDDTPKVHNDDNGPKHCVFLERQRNRQIDKTLSEVCVQTWSTLNAIHPKQAAETKSLRQSWFGFQKEIATQWAFEQVQLSVCIFCCTPHNQKIDEKLAQVQQEMRRKQGVKLEFSDTVWVLCRCTNCVTTLLCGSVSVRVSSHSDELQLSNRIENPLCWKGMMSQIVSQRKCTSWFCQLWASHWNISSPRQANGEKECDKSDKRLCDKKLLCFLHMFCAQTLSQSERSWNHDSC